MGNRQHQDQNDYKDIRKVSIESAVQDQQNPKDFLELERRNKRAFWSFLMGTHPRVGANSQVRTLPKPLIKEIYNMLKSEVLLNGKYQDDSLWTEVIQSFGGSSVRRKQNGVEIRSRAFLVPRVEGLKPSANNIIKIECDWTLNANCDMMQIATRTSAIPSNSFGEVKDGLLFAGYMDWGHNAQKVGIYLPPFSGGTPLQYQNKPCIADFPLLIGQTLRVVIFDDGTNVQFIVAQVLDKGTKTERLGKQVTVYGCLPNQYPHNDKIVFYNREHYGNCFADNIKISKCSSM